MATSKDTKNTATLEEMASDTKEKRRKYLNEKVEVTVPLTKKNQADEIVGVNGKIYRIKPGHAVKVPRYIAMALERKMKAREQALLSEAAASKNFAE